MQDFLFPSQHGQKRAQRQKKYKYLAHRPGDSGHDPSREVGHSNWVFSYADMMTSMVVFLILILSFSKINYDKLAELTEKSDDVSTESKSEQTPPGQAPQKAIEDQHVQTPMEKLAEDMASVPDMKGMQLVREGSGASIVIEDSILFESGHARLSGTALATLTPVFDALKTLPPDYVFIVEGHTDDNPIHTFEYASNWELSAARALAVVMALRDFGVSPDRLSFHAFGEFNPAKPNRTLDGKVIPENQNVNRRAIIKIRQGHDEDTPPKPSTESNPVDVKTTD